MSKLSSNVVDKHSNLWQKNIKRTVSRRSEIPLRVSGLRELCKMPLNKDVVGRFLGLHQEMRKKKLRIENIAKELNSLWNKFNFPVLSVQRVHSKITKLIDAYVTYRKKKAHKFEDDLPSVFDITKTDGNWLSSEDKHLYEQQIESKGTVGYTTLKLAPMSTIHPSKRRKLAQSSVEKTAAVASDESVQETEGEISHDDFIPEVEVKRKKYQRTRSAANLVTKYSLSTRQASRVCTSLAGDGAAELPTPSQSGIWKGVIKEGRRKIAEIKLILQRENDFCLHFDGKRLSSKEYEVVCLQSPSRKLNLGIIVCESGSAEDIFSPMKKLLDDFDAWKCIKMIVCDTTAVNTGRRNGIIVRLNKEFERKGLCRPQYVGCQHHILDLILRHLLDFCVPTPSQKPNINYDFVDKICSQYENLQTKYTAGDEVPSCENAGWRSDFKFLFELCEAYKAYKKSGKFPKIKWRKLPSLHSARWNSRATFALLAYFLLPEHRDQLSNICNFITTAWASAWFSNQHFTENAFKELHSAIAKFGCQKSIKCFKTHWVKEPSIIDVPRSNIVAERAVKIMEDIRSTCKSDKYLNIKFLNSNLQL
jgi:hypothetical protein